MSESTSKHRARVVVGSKLRGRGGRVERPGLRQGYTERGEATGGCLACKEKRQEDDEGLRGSTQPNEGEKR